MAVALTAAELVDALHRELQQLQLGQRLLLQCHKLGDDGLDIQATANTG
jgi:hypothetical protein